MQFQRQERWLILGASRGLGKTFCEKAAELYKNRLQLTVVSRKKDQLLQLAQRLTVHQTLCQIVTADFSERPLQHQLVDLARQPFDRILFFAAGGPYGPFENKQWKDHQWALNVSLIFPLEFSHLTFQASFCSQWIYVGSSVAEQQPDPLASSYASAKHGLRGWVTSVAEESRRDVRLFSPGYMNTELLPPNAKSRQKGNVWQTEEVAEALLEWMVTARGIEAVKTLGPYN